MRLQIIDERGRPLELGCSRVLILGDDGATPLGVAIDLGAGVVHVSHAAEPAFARILDSLGVSRVRVTPGRSPTVDQFTFSPRR